MASARKSFDEVLYQHQSQRPPIDPIAEKWMTSLALHVRSTLGEANMTMIPLLGSHDSATYGIHEGSDFAADAPKLLDRIQGYRYLLGPTKRIVSHWARCQSVSIIEQLYRGVRYFDIRLSPRKKELSVTPPHPKDVTPSRINPHPDLFIAPGLHELYHLPHSPFRSHDAQSQDSSHSPADGNSPSRSLFDRSNSSSASVSIDPKDDPHSEKYAEALQEYLRANRHEAHHQDPHGEEPLFQEGSPSMVGSPVQTRPPTSANPYDDEIWVSHSSISVPLHVVVQELCIFYSSILEGLAQRDKSTTSGDETSEDEGSDSGSGSVNCLIIPDLVDSSAHSPDVLMETTSATPPLEAKMASCDTKVYTDDSRNKRSKKRKQPKPLNDFLNSNLEIIVLDFQRVTNFTPQHVKSFLDIMSPLLPLFVRKPKNINTPLKQLWPTPERIFVLFPTGAMAMATDILMVPYTSPHSALGADVSQSSVSPSNGDARTESAEPEFYTPQSVANLSIGTSVSAVSSLPSHLLAPRNAPIEFLFRRDQTVIISKWFNQRFEVPLYQDCKRELSERSMVPLHKRSQLHVLQGVLTPTSRDLMVSIFQGRPRAKSILEFACDVNSKLLDIWEAHGEMYRHITFPLDGERRKSRIRRPSITSLSLPTTSDVMAVVDALRPGTPLAVDGRNILMLDFFQIGTSPLGYDAFNTACWRPCLDRFTAVSASTPLAPLALNFAVSEAANYVKTQVGTILGGESPRLDPIGGLTSSFHDDPDDADEAEGENEGEPGVDELSEIGSPRGQHDDLEGFEVAKSNVSSNHHHRTLTHQTLSQLQSSVGDYTGLSGPPMILPEKKPSLYYAAYKKSSNYVWSWFGTTQPTDPASGKVGYSPEASREPTPQ